MCEPQRSPQPVAVRRLADAVGGDLISPGGLRPDAPATVRGVAHDSRQVAAGMLFACVVGRCHDGHDHAPEAIAAGAAALLVSRRLDVAVPQIVVPDVRAALGPASAQVWGHPCRRCTLVAVTGTAGKTTVAHAIGSIAQACGAVVEVMGTLDGPHTTPEAPQWYRRVAEAADAGADLVVTEVTSHALSQGRVDGARFDAAVFTNLSHEHLDFHGTMEQYFAAKARLFDGRSDVAVINLADEWGRRLASLAAVGTAEVIGWSPGDIADVKVGRHGLSGRWRGRPIRCGLHGRLNAANVAGAAAAASALGFDDDDIARGIASIGPVPGRLWPVSGPDDDITVLVDFAHKPQALAEALASARELGSPRGILWAVFGAGGDRDRSKRAPMGAAAGRHADRIIVTSDNSRSEDPAQIAEQITAGITAQCRQWCIELDRTAAISLAIERAQPGDVVLVAGKGHETVQLGAGQPRPHDDAAVAAELLSRRRGVPR